MDELNAVYQACFPDVYHYALKLCGQQQLAEDLASDTYMRAMDVIDQFRGECQLRVWLCRIARNLYYSHLRKQGKVVLMADLPEIPEDLDPANLISLKDEGERAMLAAMALEEPARHIFHLRALQGLSFRQIAQLYGKQESWACTVYHRARKKILKMLEDEHET